MTRKSLLSTLGVLVAAVASVATSAPEPDWNLDDATEGDITLSPDQDEVTVKLRATAEVVEAGLGFDVRLDPEPARSSSTDLSDTPIVLFVADPLETGKASYSTSLTAIPSVRTDSGFDLGSRASLPPAEGSREVTVRIAWKSPNLADRYVSKCSGDSNNCQLVSVTRPLATPQTTKIHWRASIHAEGYDAEPRGAKVAVEAAQ